jgi:hypothetical protein
MNGFALIAEVSRLPLPPSPSIVVHLILLFVCILVSSFCFGWRSSFRSTTLYSSKDKRRVCAAALLPALFSLLSF